LFVCGRQTQEDSNQSFVSTAMTPGTSASLSVVSTPASPLLSRLLSNSSSKPAPAEPAAGLSPVKNVEQIAAASHTVVADDIREVEDLF